MGYGDLAPTTDLSKMFTMVCVFAGAGILVAFLNKITDQEERRRPTEPEGVQGNDR